MPFAPARNASAAASEGMADAACRGLLIAVAALAMVVPPAAPPWPDVAASVPSVPSVPAALRVAQFGSERPSRDARLLADWVARSGDNANAAFVIVDKKFARMHVFDADARLRGSSRILLGAAVGDDSVPGIGSRPIPEVRPEERTTPAGRFVAQRGRNALGENVVWVDYGAAVSMHRVRATDPRERRLERLATTRIDDKRISYGCINVPAAFFDGHIAPIFDKRNAIVYVLPEIKSVHQVFNLQQLT
jgi:hypothetical protein